MKANKTILLLFALAFAIVVRANDSVWNFNPYDYQYDMTVYVGISSIDGKNVSDVSNYQIGAFCGNECRGIAEAKAVGDKTYLYLRVRSNVSAGEVIRFMVRNLESGKTAMAQESVEFKSQQTLGYPSTPYAINAVNLCTITFDTDGGSEVAPITQDYNSAVTAPADPTKAGYTFAGWDKEIPSTMPAENITIKALWTINQYTITLDTDGGSEVAPITQDYNSDVTAPADPAKTGYTFAGWDKEIPSTMPAENITIKALWTINQYTITFDTDGGNEVAPITQDYNSDVTAPADPAKAGYTFAGWDKEIPSTMPAENITIKALWTINQYTITFDTDGGSEVAPITQDYNTAVTVPADPTKAGYTFAGWDKEIPGTMPAENITIKALWTINQYKVTFIADGIVISEETLDYGSPVTVPEAPNKEGYTFVNWGEVDETVPAHDVVYVANYEVNYYTLTYILDGEVYAEFDVAFGETIIPLEINPAEGRLFEGWQEVPVTMPSHDVKVYGTTVATDISVMATEGLLFDVYTLGGILVKKNVNVATLRSTLDSGIYIINGKKIKL